MSQPREASELEVLFSSTRQVEAALNDARAAAAKARNDLHALQTRFNHEVSQLQRQLQQYAAHDQKLKAQLMAYHLKLEAVTHDARKLGETVTRLHSDQEELKKKSDLELGIAKAGLEHSRKHAKTLERDLASARPQLHNAQGELERCQHDSEQRERRFQAAILAHQSHQASLDAKLKALEQAERATREELDRFQAGAVDAKRMKDEIDHGMRAQEDLQRRLQQASVANRDLTERLAIEKRRRENSDHAAKSAGDDKVMLSSCLKSAEERLAAAEEQISKMSGELTLLRHERKAAKQKPRYAPFPEESFEFDGIDALALTGYPVDRR